MIFKMLVRSSFLEVHNAMVISDIIVKAFKGLILGPILVAVWICITERDDDK